MTTDKLIRAFLRGECSEEELNELRHWLSLPENKEEAESLFKMKWKEISGDKLLTDYDKDAVFDSIRARVRGDVPPPAKKNPKADREPYAYPERKKSRVGFRAIAGLAIVLLIGYFVIPSSPLEKAPAAEQVTRVAPRGYRNTITLADGSTATLNSESSITYDKDFGQQNRKIFLTGEAFFNVTRDKTRPFVVVANGIKTTALGTSFNVNAYKPTNLAVSLATGKVRVEVGHENSDTPGTDEIILKPGEQAVWSGHKAGLIKREFDPLEILSWKENMIYFNNTELKSMIDVLEKWYDVQITVNGETQKLTQTGTGKFKNESLENVLSSLGYSMGFTYQISEKQITLKLKED